MPAIHDGAVGGKDDRIGEVGRVHQRRMLDESAPGDRMSVVVECVIELPDLSQRYGSNRKRVRQLDEAIDVPREQSTRRVAKVVLFAHAACPESLSMSLVRRRACGRRRGE